MRLVAGVAERVRSRFAPAGRYIEAHPLRCVLLFAVVFVLFYGLTLDHRGVGGGDELGYLRGAYHLVHSNVMSDSDHREDPVPTARRAPGYPFFLSLGIRIVPGLADHDFPSVFEFQPGVPQTPQALAWLKYMQAALLLATALGVGWLVLELTGRHIPAYFALWLVGFHPFLMRYANRLYAETLGAFLMTMLTLALCLGLRRKRPEFLAVAGLLLGCLTLTFSQWKLVGMVTVPSVFLYIVLTRERLVRLLAGATLMAVVWVSMFSYWEGRNERLTGHRLLSAGGGTVLQLRSLYDTMPWSAWFASFAYWSRSPLLKEPLVRFVDREYWKALDREDPEGVYRTARKQRVEMGQELLRELGQDAGDRDENLRVELSFRVMERSLAVIKAHPVRHLLTSIPIAFRSMMDPLFSVLYIAVYYLFLLAVFKALRNREWLAAVLLGSPLALFGFNWLATHGLPRYSEQAAPLLVFGAILGYYFRKGSLRA